MDCDAKPAVTTKVDFIDTSRGLISNKLSVCNAARRIRLIGPAATNFWFQRVAVAGEAIGTQTRRTEFTSPFDTIFGYADPTADCDGSCTFPDPASTFAQFISYTLVIVIRTL